MSRIKRLAGRQQDLSLRAVLLLNTWSGFFLFAAVRGFLHHQKDTTTVTQVGPVAFKTRQEAETGMKTKVCTEQ